MAVTAQGLTGALGPPPSLQKDLVEFLTEVPGLCRWFCLFSKGVSCGFTCSHFLGAGVLPDAGTRPPHTLPERYEALIFAFLKK